jgi:hypothetical protein
MKKRILSATIFLIMTLLPAFSQAQNPGLYIPRNIKRAYANANRSMDGTPGVQYWQNKADYKMNIDFNPHSRLLQGEVEIIYFNNSPDTLKDMYIHLYPNYYKKGQIREWAIEPADETDGVTIRKIAVNNSEIDTSFTAEKLIYSGTNVKIILDSFIAPHESTRLTVSWYYTVNQGSHVRTGGVDSTTFFTAYFFPHIAVYDDIDGWHNFNYTGTSEFYNDFGNYDVTISVPQDFVVWATGILDNPKEVLNDKYFQRYEAAKTSDEIIHIIDSSDAKLKNITKRNSSNEWHFSAENVSDFVFATSDHYLWDASSLMVEKDSNHRVLIDAAYDKDSEDFFKVADLARKCIEYMSFEFPAVPFPFPQMTVFNGSAEMEYPMMVNNWSMINNSELDKYPDKDSYLIALTAHEISHSYFPFYMGINEAKYAWMDEGWATFIDYHITKKLYDNGLSPTWGGYEYVISGELYKQFGGSLSDIPLIGDSDFIKTDSYLANSYAKSAYFYLILQDLLGVELFTKTVQEYMKRWNGKHPTPYDFFFTLNQASGEDLNWLIKPWFFEFGYADLAVSKVTGQSGKYSIEIERVGHYPVPINLKLIYEDGTVEILHENVSAWNKDETSYTIVVQSDKTLRTVKLGDVYIPDVDLTNNIYKLN